MNSASLNTSANWSFHRHVEVTANEVNIKQFHVRVEALKKRGGCITFLGDYVVYVD